MTLANYRIAGLTIEGFRAFTTPQSIAFNGRNVFIFGENGLGKSSIIEAIQWCLFGGLDSAIVPKKIEAEAALANCRALINQINAGLSWDEPFVNVSSTAELQLYLEFAASALKKAAPHP